ncbi:Uncharacterised protein [Mycobacteroides abscessus subsp. abscessus]|uniref:hypothetical protein n=1 Tax=Mycobacteroides abscessus TaxID=36809 RepID=UPI000927690B|nr:hypothetical protein [Mycobacteroides abscessus]SHU27032.1 Uncharacterised protein [Mycobacteroides abscessus subsp. abscessus]
MARVYEVTVRREGRWWMISIPSIKGLTQARQLSEVAQNATEYIAVTQEVPKSSIEVKIVDVSVPAFGKAGEHLLDKVAETRRRHQELKDMAAAVITNHVVALGDRNRDLDERLTEPDIGFLFDLSKPRINQIILEAARDKAATGKNASAKTSARKAVPAKKTTAAAAGRPASTATGSPAKKTTATVSRTRQKRT